MNDRSVSGPGVKCISWRPTDIVLALGSFLPLTLEQLARENGILQTSQLPCWGPSAPENKGDEQCIVNVLGLRITTASFAMYTFSLAVLVQALTLISFSALADYGRFPMTDASKERKIQKLEPPPSYPKK